MKSCFFSSSLNVEDVLAPLFAKDFGVRQEELVQGIVGERAGEHRNIHLRGDESAAAEVNRDVEDMFNIRMHCGDCRHVSGLQERSRGCSDGSKIIGEHSYCVESILIPLTDVEI